MEGSFTRHWAVPAYFTNILPDSLSLLEGLILTPLMDEIATMGAK
jgi:hypothetical protein